MQNSQAFNEILKTYNGPKLAKYLRREIRTEVHSLYEKTSLLKLLDPTFKEELRQLGALPFLEEFGRKVLDRQAEASRNFDESTRAALTWSEK
jgi:hypothetical protein